MFVSLDKMLNVELSLIDMLMSSIKIKMVTTILLMRLWSLKIDAKQVNQEDLLPLIPIFLNLLF
jgi:hypothetical protein